MKILVGFLVSKLTLVGCLCKGKAITVIVYTNVIFILSWRMVQWWCHIKCRTLRPTDGWMAYGSTDV